uniref:Putative secreted peptide n=1 Tax=Rhipicephalus pulchellus TaxID=72859 RepID=L7M8X3_RHIPC
MKLFIITSIMVLTTIWGDNAATTMKLCELPPLPRSAEGAKTSTRDPGYSNETTWKIGLCTGGLCILPTILEGCWNSPLRKSVPKEHIPVGCAFTCNKSREYGYYPNGTDCQHVLPDGTRIQRTCQLWKNGKICRTPEEISRW